MVVLRHAALGPRSVSLLPRDSSFGFLRGDWLLGNVLASAELRRSPALPIPGTCKDTHPSGITQSLLGVYLPVCGVDPDFLVKGTAYHSSYANIHRI